MENSTLLKTEKGRQFRDEIWDRDNGRCRLCNGPGHDVHCDTMRFGLNPTIAKVVCRNCHEAWQGFPPNHLPDDNWYKPRLAKIAELVRYLPKPFRAWYW
tara:strand:- start:326 stop:625 length:300 start_codon:yes stop_codon:yes gene_type:complete